MVCGCKITLFFRNFAICDGEITPSRQKKKKYSFFSSELDKEEKSGKTWLNEEKSITLH